MKPARTLGPFPVECKQVWFAAGGRELILARADHTVLAIDAVTGKELRRVALPKWSVIETSPDGRFVAIVPRSAKRDVWHAALRFGAYAHLTSHFRAGISRPSDQYTS
ncbi:hypothetical protein [Fimbriiglobus ruber]|uniref:hypothetical protein n=1 Tax=Fimbriiglobus ruber TaxID=1908690 RepID=UPI001179A007|nr:hypothetical protein [Fimbriiglobus ruber]